MNSISLIICTYNPDQIIFNRCLKAISEAAKQLKPLEIIIVDNNSSPSLEEKQYIKEFVQTAGQVRIVVEKKQGLTPARLLGIKEAKGDLLLFIDDDNIIANDFFSKGVEIANANPNIGSWSGQVLLEFEKQPEEWTRRYWGLLVYREFQTDLWSNLPHLETTMPCGAGLFIRKNIAEYYYQLHETGKRNIQLDRSGKSLFSGGDNDMAACACDLGFGVGLFHHIILVHFIPAFRLEKKYLLRLAEGIMASAVVLKSYRGIFTPAPSLKNKLANTLRMAMKGPIERDFFKAVQKGEEAGRLLADSGENRS